MIKVCLENKTLDKAGRYQELKGKLLINLSALILAYFNPLLHILLLDG